MNADAQGGHQSQLNQAARPVKLGAWLRILRLQFYPMAILMYVVGCAAAFVTYRAFDGGVLVLGGLCLFLIEAATVLTNELADYDSDAKNRNASIFTGGSRVIVDGALTMRELQMGVVI